MDHVNFWNANVDESSFDQCSDGFAAQGLDYGYDNFDDFSGASSYAPSVAPSDYDFPQSRRPQPGFSAKVVKASRRESVQSIPASQGFSADSGFYSNPLSPLDMSEFLNPAYVSGNDLASEILNTDLSRPTSPTGGSESENSSDGSPSARTHPLYNAVPRADGLYYCPFAEGGEDCGHEPKQLKCEYDKYIDSHLKPFRCRNPKCSDLQFSSTACLLRHEREAHEMHGHEESLCEYPPCNRSMPGNGFRRSYNCKDHMTRCHGWVDRNPVDKKKGRASSTAGVTGISKKKPAKTPSKKQQIQFLRDEFAKKKEEIEQLSRTLTCDGPLFAIAHTQMSNEMQTLKTIQAELSRLTGKSIG